MLHERMQLLLKELGMSQRQFANRLKVDPAHISRIVNGKTVPVERILLLIEREFMVNPKWLRTGTGSVFKEEEAESPEEKRQVIYLTEGDIQTLVQVRELVDRLLKTAES